MLRPPIKISQVSTPFPVRAGGVQPCWGLGPPQFNPRNAKISLLVEMQSGMAQPLLKLVWQFLVRWHAHLLCDSMIPFIRVYPREMKTRACKNLIQVFIAALSIIFKNWKQPKKVHPYNGILLSKIKVWTTDRYKIQEPQKHYGK